jgi:hypothetical protein
MYFSNRLGDTDVKADVFCKSLCRSAFESAKFQRETQGCALGGLLARHRVGRILVSVR